jgi:NAD(P)-dependent dehydrogenase (short-subunit alcohol dehydrogenase family)
VIQPQPPMTAPAGWSLDVFRLDGKVALITGASKNIGAGLAHGFAAAGADVIMVARGGQRLEAVAQSVRAANPGRRVETITADVGIADDVARIVQASHDWFPQVHVLVNNAFARVDHSGMDILAIPDQAWIDPINVNILGPYRLCRGLGQRMMAGDGGSVINLLTGSAFLPTKATTVYGTTKAALWMLTRCLALECAPKIRVNALAPGLVSETGAPKTPAGAALLPSVPMGRVGRPEEMIGAAIYLASEASSYTTGEIIFCNGGRPY